MILSAFSINATASQKVSAKMKLPVVLGVVLLACVALGGKISIPEDLDTRVVGGQNAAREQFPFIVSHNWCPIPGLCQFICGGSVVTVNRVLTAGHCITEVPDFGSFSVRAGFLLQNDPATIGQTIAVTSAVVHPNYAGGVNPNDIAILNLAANLVWNTAVQPIVLPAFQVIPTGTAALIGWGSISNTTQQILPNELQYIAAKEIISQTQCIEDLIFLFGTSSPLADTNVCTGGVGVSACSGDSGGPLAQGNTQIGIVSWGVVPCAFPRAPSVFTRVSAFIPWIISLV